jgi:hypothetical protein
MDYKKLKLDQLKDLCTKNNLPTEGRKEDLLKRLLEWDGTQPNQLPFGPRVSDAVSSRIKHNNTLIIQTKASNLAYYFNYGVIYPLTLEESEIYKNENRKTDLFTQFDQYIILSSNPINSFLEDEVLVEIIVENLKLTPLLNIFYSSEPIPISRVVGIVFENISARNTFLASTKTFPDSFIDDHLCSVMAPGIKLQQTDINAIHLPVNEDLMVWRTKLNRFDKLMGMFSFMKNVGIFFSERDNLYQEYTPNYFYALSLINSSLKPSNAKDVGLYKYILFPYDIEASSVQRLIFRDVLDIIYNNEDFDISVAKGIVSKAAQSKLASPEELKELEVIVDYFNKLSNYKIAYKDLLNDESIKKNYPVLALIFLSKFSNKSRQHTDKQAVRNTFILHEVNLNRSIVEFLLAVLGLYYGYKRMIKKDTNIKLSDNNFTSLAEQQQSIKFKLANLLDRITIESIFNFSKSGETVFDLYPFLNVKSAETKAELTFPKWGAYEYVDNSYLTCETKITQIERKNKADKLIALLDKAYPETIMSKSLLLHYVVSNTGLTKKALIDTLRANLSKLNVDEIAQIIELDQRQKNNR